MNKEQQRCSECNGLGRDTSIKKGVAQMIYISPKCQGVIENPVFYDAEEPTP